MPGWAATLAVTVRPLDGGAISRQWGVLLDLRQPPGGAGYQRGRGGRRTPPVVERCQAIAAPVRWLGRTPPWRVYPSVSQLASTLRGLRNGVVRDAFARTADADVRESSAGAQSGQRSYPSPPLPVTGVVPRSLHARHPTPPTQASDRPAPSQNVQRNPIPAWTPSPPQTLHRGIVTVALSRSASSCVSMCEPSSAARSGPS